MDQIIDEPDNAPLIRWVAFGRFLSRFGGTSRSSLRGISEYACSDSIAAANGNFHVAGNRRTEADFAIQKQAQFILVRGRVEREGASLSVLGESFTALRTASVTHASRDFH